MPLGPGTRLGPYEIVAPLGAGGMGEVYRARDTKLDRDVAIKVLPEVFVADPERIQRFQREAKTLAALNHPNIATIHGVEDANGVAALVLELVEGPTLADRLAHRALPLDEALAIARQIALAIEAAHDQGIVHRDLKPANVKIRPDETVKVLDFGLAKLASSELSAPGRVAVTQSPTLTTPAATMAGAILGTAAYMAPEQARGKPVDKRADIWAFGCVMFEMLTGTRAFGGDEVSDTLAFIITKPIEWTALPASTPVAIRRVLRRCLEKDPAKRLHDIADARIEIDDALGKSDSDAVASPAIVAMSRQPSARRSITIAAVSAVAAGAIGAAVVWLLMRTPAPAKPQLMRFAIVLPPSQPLATFGPDRDIAISADGTKIAYVAITGSGLRQLMVRAVDQVEATPLRGITTTRVPFFSPDGKWIAYFDSAESLNKVSVTGGASIVLCKISSPPRGGAWITDDTIIFATGNSSTGLLSVPAGGGEPKMLTKPDTAKGESNHWSPFGLPGGRAVLFTIIPGSGDPQVAVLDLASGRQKTLIRGGGHPVFLDSGHLVYAALGSLRAVRFDPVTLEVLSDPVPVLDDVTMGRNAADISVSRTGTLVYVPGGETGTNAANRTLAWVDRNGREEPIKSPPHGYISARLSPDDSHIAVSITDQSNPDVWVIDLARDTPTRLTFDPGADTSPFWAPDGRYIVFRSTKEAAPNLYRHAANGTGNDERLTTSQNSQMPLAYTPDGARLVYQEIMPATGQDLFAIASDGKGKPDPLMQTPFSESNADLSPDGHWMVYQSNESGRNDVYVRPFPNTASGKSMVSTSGGIVPAWSRTGAEIFYIAPNGALMAAPIKTTPSVSFGAPMKIVDPGFFASVPWRTYDVTRDGKKVLIIKNPQVDAASKLTPASMIVVLNWTEDLKARLPTR
jgi:serine/threonine-protein kinase